MKTKLVDKPWGQEFWWANTDKYIGKFIFVRKGEELSKQYHKDKDETCYIQSGKITLTIDDKLTNEYSAGKIWRIRPKVIHKIRALEDSVIIEVSTPHPEDVVRIEDKYGRI